MKLVESEFGMNGNSIKSLIDKNYALIKQINTHKEKIEMLHKSLGNASDSFSKNDRRTQQWVV